MSIKPPILDRATDILSQLVLKVFSWV